MWVHIAHKFPTRRSIFLVPKESRVGKQLALACAGPPGPNHDFAEWSDRFESLVTSAVIGARPELVGAVIYGIQFNMERWMIEICVGHATLPKVEWGSEAKREWLAKDGELRDYREEFEPSAEG